MMGMIGFSVGFIGFLMHQLIDVISEYVLLMLYNYKYYTVMSFIEKKILFILVVCNIT